VIENVSVRCTFEPMIIFFGYQYYATLWLAFRFSTIPFFHHSIIPKQIINRCSAPEYQHIEMNQGDRKTVQQ